MKSWVYLILSILFCIYLPPSFTCVAVTLWRLNCHSLFTFHHPCVPIPFHLLFVPCLLCTPFSLHFSVLGEMKGNGCIYHLLLKCFVNITFSWFCCCRYYMLHRVYPKSIMGAAATVETRSSTIATQKNSIVPICCEACKIALGIFKRKVGLFCVMRVQRLFLVHLNCQ